MRCLTCGCSSVGWAQPGASVNVSGHKKRAERRERGRTRVCFLGGSAVDGDDSSPEEKEEGSFLLAGEEAGDVVEDDEGAASEEGEEELLPRLPKKARSDACFFCGADMLPCQRPVVEFLGAMIRPNRRPVPALVEMNLQLAISKCEVGRAQVTESGSEPRLVRCVTPNVLPRIQCIDFQR